MFKTISVRDKLKESYLSHKVPMSQIKSSNQMDVSHPPYHSCLDPQPLDASAGGYNPAERAGHQEPGGDPLRARDHQPGHAELARRGQRPVGRQGMSDTKPCPGSSD